MRYKIHFCCVSHKGNVRSNNEDNYICDNSFSAAENAEKVFGSGVLLADTNPLFGVFDGMGGEECGEIASFIAAKTASEYKFDQPETDFRDYCIKANKDICQYTENNMLGSMGTTAAMLLFGAKGIHLCNVGDSRVYSFKKGKLSQISEDHVVSIDGKTKPYLSQNLGIPETEIIIQPYISEMEYENKEIFLISSDGLTDMVSNEEIERILKDTPFEESAEALLEKALENGGKDNVTIILCKTERIKTGLFGFLRGRD